MKDLRFMALWTLLTVAVIVPLGIHMWMPTSGTCGTRSCEQMWLDVLRQQEEQKQAEDAVRILTPGNPLQWMSDEQNLQAVAIECAVRSPQGEENEEVDYPGGDPAAKDVSTTMPSAAWRPQVPGPGGEEWINWACSVSKPPTRPPETINGQVLAASI